MSVNAKMTAIADAIRAKTGKTETMTLDVMAEEIDNLSVEEIIKHAEIPNYVKNEALRVANAVQAVRKDDSIVFLAMSDNHHYGAQADAVQYPDANGVQTTVSNLHAAMAAKILAYALKIDFAAQLGDATFGNSQTTIDILKSQAGELMTFLRESHTGIPCFHAIGNHDTNIYRYNYLVEQGTGTSDALSEIATGEYLFNTFTGLSASENTVFGNSAYGGYCYRDFPEKKLRVFLLNTSEMLTKTQNDQTMSREQVVWFRDALLELNTKSDASDWQFLVLCHYPADYGGTIFLSELLKAYVEGGAKNITPAETSSSSVACNFTGKNNARMIAQFHGHVHNFLTSKLWVYENGAGVQYDAWRICIPNGQFNRENYYTTVGSYTDIVFKQDVTYSKTKDTAEDTSFVINVINPSDKIIYSFCYGAGEKERIVSYGDTVYHKIVCNLSGVTINNTATNIEHGKSYSATLTPNEHYGIDSITVVMDNVDITASAYADKTINIAEVTGNVVITVMASVKLACVNQIPISTDESGNVFNSVGYKGNSYISSNDTIASSIYYVTGYIPVKIGDVVRFKNLNTKNLDHNRIVFYDGNKSRLLQTNMTSVWYMETTFNGITDDNGNYSQLTIKATGTLTTECAYMRIQSEYIDESSIITVNEEIIYVDELENRCSVTNNLSFVTNDNDAVVATKGKSYIATLTPINEGYALDTVKVIMNGIDVTASVYSNGIINIGSVTGDIVITATAVSITTYTNQLPISTDAEGNIYNGKGWKEDTYLSAGAEGNRTGIYVSGFIPIDGVQTVYFKNCGIQQNQSNHRFSFYDSAKTHITNSTGNTTQLASATGVTMTWDDNGYLTSFCRNDTYGRQAKFIRFCCGYLGEDSIVTVNEPIE